MKKFLLSIIAALCCFAASAAGTQPSTGNGSQADPYQIATLDNLLWFANHVNSGNASACAILTADITMNEGVLNSYGNLNSVDFVAWTPIGGQNNNDFAGEFNGNGHTISGLYFNSDSRNNVGLFGKAVDNAYIHDLGIKDSYFYGKDHVGGICGDFASGQIENCWNGATVYAKDWNAGGISGSCWIYASIRDCYNIGRIKPCDNNNPSYGGICGAVYANTGVDYTISNCFTLYGKCDKGVYGSLDGGCPASKINNSFVKDAAAFASGEVCYKLNRGVTGGTQKWYQTLGTDDFPVLNNSHGTVYYGYDGDVLKYSNSPISVGATHRDVCAATCNSVGYTMECWEDTRSGRVFADEACTTELNAAYVVTYSPVMTTPEYGSSIAGWPWSMKDDVTYDGVTFINPLEKVYSDGASYYSNEYVWFKVKDATANNVRLKWHLNKNTLNGEMYYKINDGAETRIDISPEIWVQNLPDLTQDDEVTIYFRITSMWSLPLTWTMSLEYCPGHNLQHNPAMAATCTENGNYENWYCTRCDTHFADAECTTVMTEWEIPALGHTPEYRAQRAATCTEDGYTMNHWHCTVCGRNYADEACTDQITEDVVLPKIDHQHKQHHDALDATCLTDGNIEYWYCPDCNTHFTDEACTTPTTEITIAALGHDFTHTPYTTSTCTSEGVVEHWHCGRCGHDFDTGDEMASEDHVIDGNLTVPLKVSDVILVGMDDGLTYDDCHTFTPPAEEGETLIATVTFDEETVMMKIKNGEETPYSLNDERPLETFFAHTFKLTAIQDPANTSDYYVTFYTSEGAYKVPKTAKAYAGTLNNEQLETTSVGDIIHKSEAVMLKADRSDITLMPSCNKAAAAEGNDLIGTDVAKTLGEGEFALSIGENGIAFYNWEGKGIGDNTAYLTGDPNVESIAIVLNGDTWVRITDRNDDTVIIYGVKKVEFLKENGRPVVRVTNADNSTVTYENPKKAEFGRQ
ncbi:MAG: hypothetical protein MJZ85_07825 [Bacteroidales bacterium]|nr:hypothetical protein [Bacteroidales bacterium]